MNQGIQVRMKQYWEKQGERLPRMKIVTAKTFNLTTCVYFFQFKCPAMRMVEVC